MPASSWTRVGRRSGFWTRPCAGRTVNSGGLTAAHPTPANPTGTAAGPGVGVSDAKQGPGGPLPEGRRKPSAPPGANDGDVRTGAGKLSVPGSPLREAPLPCQGPLSPFPALLPHPG